MRVSAPELSGLMARRSIAKESNGMKKMKMARGKAIDPKRRKRTRKERKTRRKRKPKIGIRK